MKQEIFGPVLRWCAGQAIRPPSSNRSTRTGYGLTLGIQTRIDSRADALARQAHVGNVTSTATSSARWSACSRLAAKGLRYRAQGRRAVYLPRFLGEQTITINTVAAGGNVT